ncbi:MAG: hypothetical protein ACI88H_002455 [Cocleimonas sp.]
MRTFGYNVIPKKPLKVPQAIYSILITDGLNNFTVSQLRDIYIEKSDSIDAVKARKTVYRHIFRLHNLGMLLKNKGKRVREHRYSKTELFNQIGIYTNGNNSRDKSAGLNATYKSNTETHKSLRERLNQYEVDLIASIAESEEYMHLYESHPELREHLETNYLQSRECSSKLLGQIKAIKSVISYKNKQLL